MSPGGLLGLFLPRQAVRPAIRAAAESVGSNAFYVVGRDPVRNYVASSLQVRPLRARLFRERPL